jgi:hypothetical protein
MTSGTPEVNAPTPNTGAGSVSLWHLSLGDFLGFVAATISNTTLWLMSWWVAITGMLLNVSINITLHIKDFVDSTPGVYLVWQTIRDISSLFIIFALLYASFMLILDQQSKTLGSVGNLIKNIVIGGILINFSFFIVSVLIDASNIVSLALYNGIVDTPSANIANGQFSVTNLASKAFSDGGLSAVMMDKLAIQKIYDPKNLNLGSLTSTATSPLKILLEGAVGSIIMFVTGMSFLLASLAFVARLIILIFILAFSPIWFAAMIFPLLKEKAGHLTKQLYSQLIFMPIYLLLLYAGMRVLTGMTIFNDPSNSSIWTSPSGAFVPTNLIILAINYVFIIFILNLPLVTAFGYGGMATEWLSGAVKKMGAENIWKGIGGFAGRNTIGKAAYGIDQGFNIKTGLGRIGLKNFDNISFKGLAKTRPGNWSLGRDLRFATTGALARSKMGGDRSYEDVRTIHADVVRRAAANKRLRALNGLIAKGETDPAKYHDLIDPMPPTERQELSPEIWQNTEVLKQIDGSDYKAYQASKRVEDNDVVKNKVKQNRRAALRDALGKGQNDVVEHMLEEMDGHELMKQVGKPFEKGGKETEAFKDPDFIKNLTQAHLRAFEDENLDDERKTHIGREIYNWKKNYNKNHPAFGFVTRKDNESWLPEGLRGSDKSGDRSGTDDGPRIISGSKYGPVR